MLNLYRTVSRDKKLTRLNGMPKEKYFLLNCSWKGSVCVGICPTSVPYFLRLNNLFKDSRVQRDEVKIEAERILRSLKCRSSYKCMKEFIDQYIDHRHGYELVTKAEMMASFI